MRPTLEQLLPPSELAAFNDVVDRPGVNGPAAHRWLLDRGHAVGINAVYGYFRRRRPGRRGSKRPQKLDRLPPEDREAFEQFAANPAATARDGQKFLADRNHPASVMTVWRKMKTIREQVDEVRRCTRFAVALVRVADSSPPDVHNRGALLGLDQFVFQQVYQLRGDGKIGPREISDWAQAMERVVAVREHIDQLQRKAARARDRAAGHPRAGIANGVEIANTVRRILGVPLPDEDLPALPPPAIAALPPPPTEPPAPDPPLPSVGEGRGEGER